VVDELGELSVREPTFSVSALRIFSTGYCFPFLLLLCVGAYIDAVG